MDGGRGLTSKRLFASHRTSTPPRQLLCIISEVVPLYLDALNVIKFKFVPLLLLRHYFFMSCTSTQYPIESFTSNLRRRITDSDAVLGTMFYTIEFHP